MPAFSTITISQMTGTSSGTQVANESTIAHVTATVVNLAFSESTVIPISKRMHVSDGLVFGTKLAGDGRRNGDWWFVPPVIDCSLHEYTEYKRI